MPVGGGDDSTRLGDAVEDVRAGVGCEGVDAALGVLLEVDEVGESVGDGDSTLRGGALVDAGAGARELVGSAGAGPTCDGSVATGASVRASSMRCTSVSGSAMRAMRSRGSWKPSRWRSGRRKRSCARR